MSILDKNSVVFTRIWCTFEISIAIKSLDDGDDGNDDEQHEQPAKCRVGNQKQHLYDIYTHTKDHGKVVGLTDGVVATDKYVTRDDGTPDLDRPIGESTWNGLRTIRQSSFPPEHCNKAMSIHIEQANASMDEDKNRILNSICFHGTNNSPLSGTDEMEVDLNATPLEKHESYDEINNLLRSCFAAAAHKRALESNEWDCVKNFRLALAAATSLPRLGTSFYGAAQFREEARHFTKALPVSLRFLELNHGFVLFKTSDEFAVGFGRLKKLKSFKFTCAPSDLASTSVLWNEIGALSHADGGELTDLQLSFHNSRTPVHDGLGDALSKLIQQLETLKLNFECNPGVASMRPLLKAFSMPSALNNVHNLELNFASCGAPDISGVSSEEVPELCQLLEQQHKDHEKGLTTMRLSLKFGDQSFLPKLLQQEVSNMSDLELALQKYRNRSRQCCSVS